MPSEEVLEPEQKLTKKTKFLAAFVAFSEDQPCVYPTPREPFALRRGATGTLPPDSCPFACIRGKSFLSFVPFVVTAQCSGRSKRLNKAPNRPIG